MKLEMIGINHTTSDMTVRDKASIQPNRLPQVVTRILHEPHMEGVIILSTCNRTEFYLSPTFHMNETSLRSLFAEVCGLPDTETAAAYVYRDVDAVQHLFRVASGLDSQLLGEVQILAQVKDAYNYALELASSSSFLNRAFQNAIECGKMVRHRTGISEGAVSVAYAAVDVAQKVFGRSEPRNVLLVGAGETIQLAAKYLADFDAVKWRISNRTSSNAQKIAEGLGGEVVAFPPRIEDIIWADIVFTATRSPEAVISANMAQQATLHKRTSTLFLDLAVPRDIEPSFKGGENAFVYSVDDFQDMVQANLRAREQEAMRAEKMMLKKVEEFEAWYRENRIAPTIQQLQDVLEGIRSAEVENNAKRFRTEDLEKVDRFSKSLIHKVTCLIIANMKRASLNRDDLSLASAITMAFAAGDEQTVNQIMEKLNHELSH